MMFVDGLVRGSAEEKDAFDPLGLLTPGKIVRAPKMDDRTLFRYKPGYGGLPIRTALDWSESGGFLAATEMCNNNGNCRKFEAGVCPDQQGDPGGEGRPPRARHKPPAGARRAP